ncbi:MAG: hypothetical protein KF857_05360 [Fimbriimonadaceae bacterium]|nr:hypothetical protein [Fimbriimonadaceae bacterium]
MNAGRVAVGTVLTSLAAHIPCCGPSLVLAFGSASISAGWLMALEAYRPLFLGVSFVTLAIGFVLAYQKPKVCPNHGVVCEGHVRERKVRIVVQWAVAALVVSVALLPHNHDHHAGEPGDGAPAVAAR